MLHAVLKEKKNQWLQTEDCVVKDLLAYICTKGRLRDAQIEAIETYLFLKIRGQNKPLWQLFAEGFFENTTALEKEVFSHFPQASHHTIFKNIFYGVSYADYLMSLPMGAGKTYLIAAFIYLDLYFADNEPNNECFAHNFLVLIPSGLKSSIVPSLKNIERFDPSWVLPEPSASRLKNILKFDILEEQKSAKKSNRARNPNAQKVNACLPAPFGQVFVVNAEKVILDSFRFDAQARLDLAAERKDKTNDLRELLGLIPHLSIMIDEVHHATNVDIKLRQAIHYWHQQGNITTVLGFSGTPYLPHKEKVKVGDANLHQHTFRFSQITNTVYYYPLITAVEKFLKTPQIKILEGLDRLAIIREGIKEFDKQYKNKVYQYGAIAKVAIYCSTIEVLEEEVYPFMIGELGIDKEEILKYHGGNQRYTLPKENELEFRSLNLPLSTKRYILLVQVGKEGWDCPSLTGVILSQKGDSPPNMVLQTACRCLRQADPNTAETALIFLNKENAEILNQQLQEEQHNSISELGSTKRTPPITKNEYSKDHIQIRKNTFIQKVIPQSIDNQEIKNTREQLKILINTIENYKTEALIRTSNIHFAPTNAISEVTTVSGSFAHYHQWLFEIMRQSFGRLTLPQMYLYDNELSTIFERISFEQHGTRFFNELYDLDHITSTIRIAYYQ